MPIRKVIVRIHHIEFLNPGKKPYFIKVQNVQRRLAGAMPVQVTSGRTPVVVRLKERLDIGGVCSPRRTNLQIDSLLSGKNTGIFDDFRTHF